ELVAAHIGVQLARRHRGRGVVGAVRLPRAGVPHDHVTGAVLAPRDHALEVEVLHRVVLDMDSQPFHRGVQGWAPGYGPARQHTVDLEAQVVVHPAGPVALDHEPALPVGRWGLHRPGRLRGAAEARLGRLGPHLPGPGRRVVLRRVTAIIAAPGHNAGLPTATGLRLIRVTGRAARRRPGSGRGQAEDRREVAEIGDGVVG